MKFFIQKLNSIIQSLNYDYNTIGNRLLVCQNDLLIQGDYNSWNQLTNRFFHGDLGYFGTATATNSRLLTTLFVDGTNLINSTTNKHEFTRIFHLLNTKSGNLNTNNSKLGNYCYDANGNLTNDGEHSYSYNMENRLTKCSTSVSLVNYSYDGLGRKVKSKEINLTTGKTNETKFIYNNWNVIGEITTSQLHRLTSSYFWGNDLSGSLHGAGGIGGLLANSPFSKGGGGGFYFYNYDANGNVINLIDSEGETAAHYEYSPFGKTISKIGYYAETNKFRFSTKRFEEVGELYYYGFRYYKPKTGNWLTRDPIAENGGKNLYVFVLNSPISDIDILGNHCKDCVKPLNAQLIYVWTVYDTCLWHAQDIYDFRIKEAKAAYDQLKVWANTVKKGCYWTCDWLIVEEAIMICKGTCDEVFDKVTWPAMIAYFDAKYGAKLILLADKSICHVKMRMGEKAAYRVYDKCMEEYGTGEDGCPCK